MLRGPSTTNPSDAAEANAAETGVTAPDNELPFTLEDRSPGIAFYRAKESFYHPYALLQSMRWQGDKLTLRFASLDVEIIGRGLQIIYAHLAAHRVARLTEQGERYANVTTA